MSQIKELFVRWIIGALSKQLWVAFVLDRCLSGRSLKSEKCLIIQLGYISYCVFDRRTTKSKFLGHGIACVVQD